MTIDNHPDRSPLPPFWNETAPHLRNTLHAGVARAVSLAQSGPAQSGGIGAIGDLIDGLVQMSNALGARVDILDRLAPTRPVANAVQVPCRADVPVRFPVPGDSPFHHCRSPPSAYGSAGLRRALGGRRPRRGRVEEVGTHRRQNEAISISDAARCQYLP